VFYHLFYPLRDFWFGFNVFRYITFRATLACVTSFLISVVIGPFIIRGLRNLKIWETTFRKDAPALFPLHRQKESTPTMGGLLIIFAVIISTLLWADYLNKFIIISLIMFIWLGFIGFLDDYIKLKSRSRGLMMTTKIIGQVIPAFLIGLYLFLDPEYSTNLDVPFFKKLVVDLGVFYIFFVMLVMIASSNAVNITDGLDGLAIGCTGLIALSYAAFSYVSGHQQLAEYLRIIYMPASGELAVFCASLVGASLGFLWFNSYPATVFMGDTGSLALGGAIGPVAVLVKKELLLLLVGGIFVVEALSVILQVASFRLKGKRIFLMAPLHHHFQLKGWSESKITIRFWILAVVFALLSLITLKLR
jgi:phospho-N-acetylmuramoyl-pentapeptide-transferase